jgi:lipopolysaccharide transport system ATP-binding protein
MNAVIKVENVSKQYRLGNVGTGSFGHDLNRWWYNFRGKEDPYLKIGEANDRTIQGTSEYVWALKDINFEVEAGEVLGIIGRNGAGKSTLLKILSRTTSPTQGKIYMKGRVASLLEVGTGFHPDLTGRENIYLNGAIMGMTRKDIGRKFDEIVDFSGVERYIDTPVKRYSSGMYVRLGFAVAAYLKPDILIVDEVLAVGDAEFQKKCLSKMKDVSTNEGRTVLFVSHNMSAIQNLCKSGVLLETGSVKTVGAISNLIDKYLSRGGAAHSIYYLPIPENVDTIAGHAYEIRIENKNAKLVTEILVGSSWQVRVCFKIMRRIEHFIAALSLTDSYNTQIRTSWSVPQDIEEGYYEAVFREESIVFAAGTYNITVGLSTFERPIHYIENAAMFSISDVAERSLDSSIIRTVGIGVVLNPMNISITQIEGIKLLA